MLEIISFSFYQRHAINTIFCCMANGYRDLGNPDVVVDREINLMRVWFYSTSKMSNNLPVAYKLSKLNKMDTPFKYR